MPQYSFYCKCGRTKEVMHSMNDAGGPILCECGQQMIRDFRRDLPNVGDKEYSRPIVSDSLAIMPSQREEHQRLHPDVKLDSECRPVFENYRQHDDYLKKTGFRKQRQRIKKRGKRIA